MTPSVTFADRWAMGMKKKVMVVLSVTVICVVGVIVGIAWKANNESKVEKNYGMSHALQNIDGGKVEPFDADAVVPTVDELLKNLEDKQYSITEYESFTEENIPCNRIYAEKGNQFIDICQGLDLEMARKAFSEYEKMYNTYYILAQNDEYVCCVSDKKCLKLQALLVWQTMECNTLIIKLVAIQKAAEDGKF